MQNYKNLVNSKPIYNIFAIFSLIPLKFLFAFLVYFAVLSCSAVPSQKDTKKGELGLSISNPIKVNSVPEEYQYIRENCEGCRVISQALINEGKSYYDELKVQKPDGTTVSYFFDINSFYLDF